MDTTNKRAALDTAKEQRDGKSGTDLIDLPYGMQGKILPVAARLLDDVLKRIKDPEPPMLILEGKDRPEPNYSDPEYLKGMRQAEQDRASAGMDAMLIFGLQIVGELNIDGWMDNLRLMQKFGQVDLSGFDMNDPLEVQYLYKRYIASTPEVFERIGNMSGISPVEVARKEEAFQGDKARKSDS